jgi:hypothetical protein
MGSSKILVSRAEWEYLKASTWYDEYERERKAKIAALDRVSELEKEAAHLRDELSRGALDYAEVKHERERLSTIVKAVEEIINDANIIYCQRDDDCEAWKSVELLIEKLRDQWAKAQSSRTTKKACGECENCALNEARKAAQERDNILWNQGTKE